MNRALLLFFSKADGEKLLELNIDEKLLGGCFCAITNPFKRTLSSYPSTTQSLFSLSFLANCKAWKLMTDSSKRGRESERERPAQPQCMSNLNDHRLLNRPREKEKGKDGVSDEGLRACLCVCIDWSKANWFNVRRLPLSLSRRISKTGSLL